jgi:hypothetical protein
MLGIGWYLLSCQVFSEFIYIGPDLKENCITTMDRYAVVFDSRNYAQRIMQQDRTRTRFPETVLAKHGKLFLEHAASKIFWEIP